MKKLLAILTTFVLTMSLFSDSVLAIAESANNDADLSNESYIISDDTSENDDYSDVESANDVPFGSDNDVGGNETVTGASDPTASAPPVIAPSGITYCGLPEHTHSQFCYDETGMIICDISAHMHTELCYNYEALGLVNPIAIEYDDPDEGFVITMTADGGCTITFTGTKVPSRMDLENKLVFNGVNYTKTVTRAVINDSVAEIGEYAFQSFSSLIYVDFQGVNTRIKNIPNCAFQYCSSLRSIDLDALYALESLSGTDIFQDTAIMSLRIPSTVNNINRYAFRRISSLETVYFEENHVLSNLPSFEGCTSLKNINLENLKADTITVSDAAFRNCTSLRSLTIPSSFTGQLYAFASGCSALKTITIEENSRITYFDTTINDTSIEELDLSPLTNPELVIRISSDSLKKITLPETLKKSPDTLNCPNLTNVVFGKNSSIEEIQSFNGCSSLAHLDLSVLKNLKSIDAQAFGGCTSLLDITIPSTVTNIGSSAFSDCTSLKRIKINSEFAGANLSGAFNGVSGFVLEIGENVSVMSNSMLEEVDGKWSVLEFPADFTFTLTPTASGRLSVPFNNLYADQEYTFVTDGSGNLYRVDSSNALLVYALKDLTEVTIPATVGGYRVTSVESDAFNGCIATSVSFDAAENITNVAQNAFANAKNLAEINGEDTIAGVKSSFPNAGDIPDNAFSNTIIGALNDDLTSGYLDKSSAYGGTIKAGGIELVVNDSNHTQDSERSEQFEYLTGQAAGITMTLSDLNESYKYRVYVLADDADTLSFDAYSNFTRIDGTNVFYRDYAMGDFGETNNRSFLISYPDYPTAPGTKAYVWCAQIPVDDDATIYCPGVADGNNVIVSENYIELEWNTKRLEFELEKEVIKKNIGSSSDPDYVPAAELKLSSTDKKPAITGLGYEITLSNIEIDGYDSKFGADYVRYIDFEDTLALHDGLVWRELDLSSVRVAYSNGNSRADIYAIGYDGNEYLVANLSGFSSNKQIVSAGLKKANNGGITVCWTVKNTSIDTSSPSEIILSSGEKIEFGGEVILVSSSTVGKYTIDNDLDAVVKYTHTSDLELKAHHDGVEIEAGKGTVSLSKSWVKRPTHLNEEASFKLTITNNTAYDYTGGNTMTDWLDTDTYLTAEEIQRLLDDPEIGKYVVAHIGWDRGNARYAGLLITNERTDTVTGIDGTTTGTLSYGNSTENDLADYGVGYTSRFEENKDYTRAYIEIKWSADYTYVEIKNKGSVVATVGEGKDYETIAKALSALKVVILPNTECGVEWKLPAGEFVVKAGETKEYIINAMVKDTTMMVYETEPDGGTDRTFGDRQYAAGWTNEDVEKEPEKAEWLIGNSAQLNNYLEIEGPVNVTRDLSIHKKAIIDGEEIGTQEGNNSDITDKLRLDMEMDYVLYLRHYGAGTYDVLPLIDHMEGLQVALAKVSDNPNAEWANHAGKYYDENGVPYYALNQAYTYKGVYFGDYYADSVTVTEQKDSNNHRIGFDTIIRFYFFNTVAADFTHRIVYKVTTDRNTVLGNDAIYLEKWELNNGVWVNDVPGRRIRDNLLHDGTLLVFDKNIVTKKGTSPAGDALTKKSTISQEGNVVTYRLRLYNNSKEETVTIYGSQFSDVLPNTYDVFEWKKATDNAATGNVTLSYYAAGSVPEVKYNDVSGTITSSGIVADGLNNDEWTINEGTIEWNNGLTFIFEPGQSLYIYVTVTYPSESAGATKDGEWDKYYSKVKGTNSGCTDQEIVNRFFVYGQERNVEHSLVGSTMAFIQKGVYDTGAMVARDGGHQSLIGNRIPFYSGADRLHFSYSVDSSTAYDKKDGIIGLVTYYVVIANTGTENLYLTDLYDVLPEGFGFYSLRCSVFENPSTHSSQIGTWIATEMGCSSYGGLATYGSTIADAIFPEGNKEKHFRSVSVKYNGTNGRTMSFSFSKDTYSASWDPTAKEDPNTGLVYLEPGTYTQFAYEVTTCSKEEMKGATEAVNSAFLECYVPGLSAEYAPAAVLDIDTGVEVIDFNHLSPNDGDRKIWTYEDIVSAGATDVKSKRESTAATQEHNTTALNNSRWFASSVTVIPGDIIPGISKRLNDKFNGQFDTSDPTALENPNITWDVMITNSGTSAMVYDFVDTIELPLKFRGKVTYEIYSGVNSVPRAINGINGGNLMLTSTGGGKDCLFEITDSTKDSITILTSSGTTVNLTKASPTKQISIYLFSPYDKNNLVLAWSVPVTLTVDEETGTMSLKIEFSKAGYIGQWGMTVPAPELIAIPAGGYAKIGIGSDLLRKADGSLDGEIGTYINTAYAYPTDSYSASRVTMGSNAKDESGRKGVCSYDVINIHNGFPTSSYKEIIRSNAPQGADQHYLKGSSKKDAINDRIIIDNTNEEFEYHLHVSNDSQNLSMDKLVIIDILPHADDTNVIGGNRDRNSEFSVNFANDDVKVYIVGTGEEISGNTPQLDASKYSVEFSETVTDFLTRSDEDWKGAGNNPAAWSANCENARAMRITINDAVKSGQEVVVVFTAKVESNKDEKENAHPGEIAWNSFGYWYQYQPDNASDQLSATGAPLNVGLTYPSVPSMQKKVIDPNGKEYKVNSKTTFKFVIYKGDSISFTDYSEASIAAMLQNKDFTVIELSVHAGNSESDITSLDGLKKWISNGSTFSAGTDDWKWENGTTYHIVEVAPPDDSHMLFDSYYIFDGKVTTRQCEYKYSYEDDVTIIGVNRVRGWNIEITKVDSKNSDPLAGAVFGIYSPRKSDQISNSKYAAEIKVGDITYYLAKTVTTGNDGVAEFKDLTEDGYIVVELEAPQGYKKSDEQLVFRRSDAVEQNGVLINSGVVQNDELPPAPGTIEVLKTVTGTADLTAKFEIQIELIFPDKTADGYEMTYSISSPVSNGIVIPRLSYARNALPIAATAQGTVSAVSGALSNGASDSTLVYNKTNGNTQGIITLYLHRNEKFVLENVPYGTIYKITETLGDDRAYSYTVTYTDCEGKVKSEAKHSAVINNTEVGSVLFEKKVDGASVSDADFTFIVLFRKSDDTTLAGTYEYYNKNGDKLGSISSGGTIAVKSGDSIMFRNLPTGTKVFIGERSNPDDKYYKLGVRFDDADQTVEAITVNQNTYKGIWYTVDTLGIVTKGFEFNNAEGNGQIKFQKRINSKSALTDQSVYFAFEIILKDSEVNGKPITGTFETEYVYADNQQNTSGTISFDKNGKATVYLRGYSESDSNPYYILIKGLPTGAYYSITEKTDYYYIADDNATVEGASSTVFRGKFLPVDDDGNHIATSVKSGTVTEDSATTPIAVEFKNDEIYKNDILIYKKVIGKTPAPRETYIVEITFKFSEIDSALFGSMDNIDYDVFTAAGDVASDSDVLVSTGAFVKPATQTDTKYTVSLTNGQYVKIYGLPDGLEFEIKEQTGETFAYTPVYQTDDGSSWSITDDTSISDEVGNDNNYRILNIASGNLTLTKQIEGINDPNLRFDLTVELDLSSFSTDYAGIGLTAAEFLNRFVSGAEFSPKDNSSNVFTATVTVTAGQTVTITGLPIGAVVTVTESGAEDYECEVTYGSDSEATSVTITDGATAEVTVCNTLKSGNVVISKTVSTSNSSDQTKEFDFIVTFTPPTGVTLASSYKYIKTGVTGEQTITLSDAGDGKMSAVFKLKHNQTITFKGLPVGTTFTVAETGANDYTAAIQYGSSTTATSGKVVADADSPAAVSVTNIRKTGSVELNKTLNAASGTELKDHDRGQLFTFTVNITETNGTTEITGPFSYTITAPSASGTDTDERALSGNISNGQTVQLKGGEKLTISGLPVGAKVRFTETAHAGYQSDKTNNTAEVTVVSGTTPVSVTFQNTKKAPSGSVSVDLEAEKTIVNDDIADYADDNAFTFTITPDQNNPEGDPITADKRTVHNDAAGKITLFSNATYTKVGTYIYTVKETPVNGKIRYSDRVYTVKVVISEEVDDSGYTGKLAKTVTVTYKNAEGTDVTLGTDDKITFENTYITELVISKTVVEKNSDGTDVVVTSDEEDFTFRITLSGSDLAETYPYTVTDQNGNKVVDDRTFTVSIGTITLKHGQTATITGLPAGTAYTVTEPQNNMPDNYEKVSSSGDSSEIAKGTSTNVSFTNRRLTPGISIEKTATKVNGKDLVMRDGVIYVKPGDVVTYSVTVTANGENGTVNHNVVVTDTLPAGFTADKVSNISDGGKLENGVITWKLGNMTAGNSSTGTKTVTYDVTIPIVTVSTTWENVASVASDENPENPPSEETVRHDPGRLTITKTVVDRFGTDVANDTQTFTFKVEFTVSDELASSGIEISDSYPYVITENGLQTGNGTITKTGEYTLTLKHGQTATISDIPTGIDYTVTEIIPAGAKYEQKTPANNTSATGSITNETPTVSFVNTYIPNITETTVTVNKTLSLESVLQSLDGRTFSFTMEAAKNNPAGMTLPSITTVAMTATTDTLGSAVFGAITFVKAGVYKVIITEVPSGYADVHDDQRSVIITFEIEDKNGVLSVKSTRYAYSDDPAKTATGTPTFENTVNEAPHITIEKVQRVNSDNKDDNTRNKLTVEAEDIVTYTLIVTNDGNSTAKGVKVTDKIPDGLKLIKIFDNGYLEDDEITITWNLGDMPADSVKEVSFQVSVPKVNEYTRWLNIANVSYDNNPENPDDPGEPNKKEPSNEVEIESEPRPTGSLTVTKTVTGNMGDKSKEFTFTVTLSDSTVNGEYGDMKFVSGVAEFTLKHGESKTAEGLPAGITYKVTETGNEGYDVSCKNAEGSIPDEGVVTAAYVNHKEFIPRVTYGSLSISKTVVSSDIEDYDTEFTFVITLTDSYGNPISGRYSYQGSKTGSIVSGGTITLKHGESVTITGIPCGTLYSVTEISDKRFSVISSGTNGTINDLTKSVAEFTNVKIVEIEVPEEGMLSESLDESVSFDSTILNNGLLCTGAVTILGLILLLASLIKRK